VEKGLNCQHHCSAESEMRLSFSIRALLVSTAIVGAGCSTVLHGNALLTSGLFLFAVVSLLFGIVAALVRRGPARDYWIGFVVFGVGYFGLALHWDRAVARPDNSSYGYRFPITNVIVWARWKTSGEQPPMVTMSGPGFQWMQTTAPYWSSSGWMSTSATFYPTLDRFSNTVLGGHSLSTVLFAIAGGWAGSRFGVRSEP
jgi:hypothetical protein